MLGERWEAEPNPTEFWHYNLDSSTLPARKFYLFVAEIGHRLRSLVTNPGTQRLIELCEQCGEGNFPESALRATAARHRAKRTAREDWRELADEVFDRLDGRTSFLTKGLYESGLSAFGVLSLIEGGHLSASATFEEMDAIGWHVHPDLRASRKSTGIEWGGLVRCIYGPNPFIPQPFSPAWQTEHAVGIAAKMYDERDFAAMPILADAIEEAGCDNADILTHCREPGGHVRGCWVVDLVLGKS